MIRKFVRVKGRNAIPVIIKIRQDVSFILPFVKVVRKPNEKNTLHRCGKGDRKEKVVKR